MAQKVPFEIVERVRVNFFSLVEQDQGVAEGHDVVEVMAGQDDGRCVRRAVPLQELAYVVLGDDVQPYGGLVEKDDVGFVEQCGYQLHLHPFPEGQAPHLYVDQLLHAQQCDHHAQGVPVVPVLHPVNRPVQLEGIQGRQVPPQLALVSHDHGDAAQVFLLLVEGAIPQNVDPSPRGHDQAGQHFQRGGLSRPVQADQAGYRPPGDLKGKVVDRAFKKRLAMEQVPQAPPQPRFLFVIRVILADPLRRDDAAAANCPRWHIF